MGEMLLRREKRFLAGGTVVACLCLLGYLGLPVWEQMQKIRAETTQTQGKLRKYQALIKQKSQIRGKYRQLSGMVNAGNLPTDESMSALSELEELTKAAGVVLVDMRPQSAAGRVRRSGKETLFDLRIQGQLDGILKFIYTLENTPSLLTIKKVQITSGRRPGQPLEGTFVISQTSY
jgi:hypothetical protein